MRQLRFRFTPVRTLAIAIALFSSISFAGQYAKYQAFGYNALDLPIYTQVIHESGQGRLFAFTIHPHSYLGDHVELFLLALVPFYKLVPGPLTLLLLQTIGLALAAIPLFRIAKRRLSNWWGVGVAGAYILSPFIWNLNFYEFHLLPFAIPLLMAALDAYESRRLNMYWLWLGLALLVREDVALVVGGLGILALLQRRRWTWWLVPMLGSSVWFITALKIAAAFGTLGQYKFLRFYAWLGPDLKSIVENFFAYPLLVIKHFFTIDLVVFVIGLGLPFAFVFFFASMWLIPALPILVQLGLGHNAGEIALEIHYTSLFLPFLFVGAVVGLSALFNRPHRSRAFRFFAESRGATAFLLAAITIYCFVVIGPIRGVVSVARPDQVTRETQQLRADVLALVPPAAPLATGYALLSQAAERDTLASLHYVYLGTEQYSDRPYHVPDPIRTVLIDESDFLLYHVVYPETDEKYRTGADRYRALLDDRHLKLTAAVDDLALYQADGPANPFVPIERMTALPNELAGTPIMLPNGLTLHGWTNAALNLDSTTIRGHRYIVLPVTLYWSQSRAAAKNNSIRLTLKDDNRTYQKEYPLAPLFPQQSWSADEYIATRHRFLVPTALRTANIDVSLSVIDSEGALSLDSIRSITPRYHRSTTLGTAALGRITASVRD